MTDDRFRLTALDARRWDFGSALRGFDRARVLAFRDQVAEELETMARANQELETKVNNFLEQLRVFRERDKALNDALVSAQQLRGEIRTQAEREAQLIVREARGEAERIVATARADAERAEGELQALWRSRQSFLSQMRTLVERQTTELATAAQVEPPMAFAARNAAPAVTAASATTTSAAQHRGAVDGAATSAASSAASSAGAAAPVALTDSPDVQDALDALKQALESDVNSLETFSPTSRTPTDNAVGEPGEELLRSEPPVRPSMPTPSWLGTVRGEENR